MEKHHRNKKHCCHNCAQIVESLLERVVPQVLEQSDSFPDPVAGRFSMTDGTLYLRLQMPAITPAPPQEEFKGALEMLNPSIRPNILIWSLPACCSRM